jgi:signal peptidase I
MSYGRRSYTMKKKIELGVAITLILCVFILPQIFQIGVVKSGSMEKTIAKGTLTFINKRNYNYERGDIIAFKAEGKILCKRLIAKGGDAVSIQEGNVYVNGLLLSEPYTQESKDSMKEMTVPMGMYFVMGDNRLYSIDSRDYGPIQRDTLIGKVTFCIYPFKRLQYKKPI